MLGTFLPCLATAITTLFLGWALTGVAATAYSNQIAKRIRKKLRRSETELANCQRRIQHCEYWQCPLRTNGSEH
jgi:translation initiation factor 2 gamma subunit (eIF-2gamma)